MGISVQIRCVFVYSVGVYNVYIVYAVCVGVWVCSHVSVCPPISRVAGSSLPLLVTDQARNLTSLATHQNEISPEVGL